MTAAQQSSASDLAVQRRVAFVDLDFAELGSSGGDYSMVDGMVVVEPGSFAPEASLSMADEEQEQEQEQVKEERYHIDSFSADRELDWP